MRVVFFGTPLTAVPALVALRGAGHEIPLVVTQPDRASGRGGITRPPPVKERAVADGLEVAQPETIRSAEFLATFASARADVVCVVAFGSLLPRRILDLAPLGAVNVHFSLLPRLRGAAPVQWALARGETETGVTTFRLDEGLDTGPILQVRHVPIVSGEHAPELLARLAQVGAALLVETVAGLAAGTIVPRPQEEAGASLAPRLTRADGAWEPGWTARETEGRVRGFDPWPGVWMTRGGRRIRIASARARDGISTDAAAGSVIGLEGDGLLLACAGRSVLSLLAIQPEGRRSMSAIEAINGRHVLPGDRIERPQA